MDILEAVRKNFTQTAFTEDFTEHGQIILIQFSPFEWSQDLIFIGFETKILLGLLNCENDPTINILSEFRHSQRCTCLSISPETSLHVVPNLILFCVGGNDFKLRIFSSDLHENNTCRVLSGHSSYINDTSFDPENSYLVSVSDDNTAKLWQTEDFKLTYTFNLTSPGMAVCWHRSDGSKLMVAEKIGIIRFYNVETKIPIMSIDYGKSLTSVHWSPSDCQIAGSLHSGELLIWDLTKPCLPVQNIVLFPDNGGNLKFSPHGELVAATNSLDGTLKVIHIKSQRVKLTSGVTLPTNVCWHYRYPLVCTGDDSKLCFWKI